MPVIAAVSGSPTPASRTHRLVDYVGRWLAAHECTVRTIDVRSISPEALFDPRRADTALRSAIDTVDRADGVIVVTPVYNSAYSGMLKAFLDSLPQYGLSGKVVLPLAIGGTLAHVLAIDCALRPVLMCLGALHVTAGLFFCRDDLSVTAEGELTFEPKTHERLRLLLEQFELALRFNAANRERALRCPMPPSAPLGAEARPFLIPLPVAPLEQ